MYLLVESWGHESADWRVEPTLEEGLDSKCCCWQAPEVWRERAPPRVGKRFSLKWLHEWGHLLGLQTILNYMGPEIRLWTKHLYMLSVLWISLHTYGRSVCGTSKMGKFIVNPLCRYIRSCWMRIWDQQCCAEKANSASVLSTAADTTGIIRELSLAHTDTHAQTQTYTDRRASAHTNTQLFPSQAKSLSAT